MQPALDSRSAMVECQSVHVAARTVHMEVSVTGFVNAIWIGQCRGLKSSQLLGSSMRSQAPGLAMLVMMFRPGKNSRARLIMPVMKNTVRIGPGSSHMRKG